MKGFQFLIFPRYMNDRTFLEVPFFKLNCWVKNLNIKRTWVKNLIMGGKKISLKFFKSVKNLEAIQKKLEIFFN